MIGSLLGLLDGVLDVDVPVVAVAEVARDALALVADDEDELVDVGVAGGLQDEFEQRSEKSLRETEDYLNEMPGILAVFGLDKAPNYSSLCRWEQEYRM